MFSGLKSFFARRSRVLKRALGDVVEEREAISATRGDSYVKCRLKQSVDGSEIFISLEVKPDYLVGAEGSSKYWIDFDVASAERLRDSLDSCIMELKTRAT